MVRSDKGVLCAAELGLAVEVASQGDDLPDVAVDLVGQPVPESSDEDGAAAGASATRPRGVPVAEAPFSLPRSASLRRRAPE